MALDWRALMLMGRAAREKRIMDTELKENLGSKDAWRRLLYMLLYVVIFELVSVVLALLVLVQIVLTLLTGGANARLKHLGDDLGAYLHRSVAFLAYTTEDMPYPFSPWSSAPTKSKKKPARKPKSEGAAEGSA